MRFSALILRAADEELGLRGDVLGLRLSPVRLSAPEANDLFDQAAAALGEKVYVSIAAPGVTARLDDRRFVAPDERAAEKATEWRNTAHPSKGEHLLYVSAEVFGRAGGLADCLHELNERSLRSCYRRWCDSKGSGFPNGFGEVLDSTGLLDSVSSHQLCEFAANYEQCREAGHRGWDAIGLSLGHLYLASDTRLRASDAGDRIRANMELVARVSTSERQRSSRVTEDEELLLSDLGLAARGLAEFASVDLGGLQTSPLIKFAGIRSSRRSKASSRRKKSPRRKAKKGRQSSKRDTPGEIANAPHDKRNGNVDPSVGGSDPEFQFINSALTATSSTRGEETRKQGAKLVADTTIWSESAQRGEFQDRQPVPSSLLQLLVSSAESDGGQQTWLVRGDPSQVERRLPTAYQHTSRPLPTDTLQDELDAWRATRRTVIDELTLRDAKPSTSYRRFIDAPLLTLHSDDLRQAITAHLSSVTELLRRVAESNDAGLMADILNFETVLIRSRSGPAHLVVAPLHPLWLSQAISRYTSLLREPDLDLTARVLLARSLVTSPVAPHSWPIAEDEWLERTAGRLSVPTYQSRMESVDGPSVRDTVQKLLSRFVEMHPHANLALQVRVSGRGASGALEGLGAFLDRNQDTKRAWLHTDSSLDERTSAVANQLESGRLQIAPVHARAETSNLHVTILVDPDPPEPQFDEPAAPTGTGHTGGVGLLPTRFEIRGGALHVETPLDGHPELLGIERVIAGIENRSPRGSFAYRGHSISLSALLGTTASKGLRWDSVIAPRVSARPPDKRHLVLHERISEDCEIAAITGDIAPTGRWLEKSLKSIGVQDLRPRTLQHLAHLLADAGGRGLVSLDGGSGQLLAAGLLGLSLRELSGDDDALIASVDGSSYRTLFGRDPAKDSSTASMLLLFYRKDTLHIQVGLASTEHPDLAIHGKQFGGGLGKGLNRALSILRLACESDSLGGCAAREELSWVLWPALASISTRGTQAEELVRMIQPGVKCEISVHVLFPESALLAKLRHGAKRVSAGLSTRTLNVDTLESLMLSSR